jgi:hypothetical protein
MRNSAAADFVQAIGRQNKRCKKIFAISGRRIKIWHNY